jgi:hypothetical protein
VAGEKTSTTEAAEVAWLAVDEVRNQLDEAYAIRMLDGLLDGPPKVRVHDGVRLVR